MRLSAFLFGAIFFTTNAVLGEPLSVCLLALVAGCAVGMLAAGVVYLFLDIL